MSESINSNSKTSDNNLLKNAEKLNKNHIFNFNKLMMLFYYLYFN